MEKVMLTKDPTQRFSNRVENYIKYRPGYPKAILKVLKEECGLTQSSVIADIGSGTGMLSKPFLQNGNHVFGVEPNQQMRDAGERFLKDFAQFQSIAGAAESTTLRDRVADFIVAGQSFHWFDRNRARQEFARIVKANGWVVLVWNDHRKSSTAFLRAYEELLVHYANDYQNVDHTNVTADVIREFFNGPIHQATFENHQQFDFEGIRGRLLSASYMPSEDQPSFVPMLEELQSIFQQHQQNGQVRFEGDTRMYYGQLR